MATASLARTALQNKDKRRRNDRETKAALASRVPVPRPAARASQHNDITLVRCCVGSGDHTGRAREATCAGRNTTGLCRLWRGPRPGGLGFPYIFS